MNDAPSKDNPSSEPKGAAQTRPLWAAAGLLSLGLGLVGIFLPVLPTTPLVILAAFCFTRGSPRLRNWITGHGTFGPIIEDWEATGAIPQRVKFWACTVMTLRMYANLKKIPMKNATVTLTHSREHGPDCQACDAEHPRIDVIDRQIQFEGNLSQEDIDRLLVIADKCPVHRTLHNKIDVRTALKE